jgi:hypothetical protein
LQGIPFRINDFRQIQLPNRVGFRFPIKGLGILHGRTIFEALSTEIRRPRGLGRKNVWNALIRQRLPLVLKTTAIEQTDASIFSVGVGASRSVLSVVHFERHECAGGLRNQ